MKRLRWNAGYQHYGYEREFVAVAKLPGPHWVHQPELVLLNMSVQRQQRYCQSCFVDGPDRFSWWACVSANLLRTTGPSLLGIGWSFGLTNSDLFDLRIIAVGVIAGLLLRFEFMSRGVSKFIMTVEMAVWIYIVYTCWATVISY